MLVDDHPMVRSAIRQAISAPDIEVVGEASSAEEALELALKLRPDVLLLDIDLPGMSGVQLLREIAPRLPDTKIVMLTVSSGQRHALEAVRHGASGYLTKDLTPEALQRSVRGLRQGDLAMPRKLAAQVVKELSQSARQGRTAPAGQMGLSDREDEVLRLLAEGMTDRQIAEVLMISPRTVETHVGNILNKLAVRNRAEAAQRYREGG